MNEDELERLKAEFLAKNEITKLMPKGKNSNPYPGRNKRMAEAKESHEQKRMAPYKDKYEYYEKEIVEGEYIERFQDYKYRSGGSERMNEKMKKSLEEFENGKKE